MKFSPPSKVDVGRARSEWGPPQLRRKFGGGIHIKHRPRFFPPPSYLFLRPSFNAINANTGRTNSNSLRSRNTAAYLRSGPPKLLGCSKRFYGRACTFKTFACASQIVRQEEAFFYPLHVLMKYTWVNRCSVVYSYTACARVQSLTDPGSTRVDHSTPRCFIDA